MLISFFLHIVKSNVDAVQLLQYTYYAGVIFIGLKDFEKARNMFEMVEIDLFCFLMTVQELQ